VQWCSIILWYHPRCLLHSWSHIVTLWATIATHKWAKIAENGWKQTFDNTYLHDFSFYTQVCAMGQQVVFNYPMASPEVPTTLKTPYRYNMGHYSQSFMITRTGNRYQAWSNFDITSFRHQPISSSFSSSQSNCDVISFRSDMRTNQRTKWYGDGPT
jgi:hypothetical protein